MEGDGGLFTMKIFFRMAPFFMTVNTGIFISSSFLSPMFFSWMRKTKVLNNFVCSFWVLLCFNRIWIREDFQGEKERDSAKANFTIVLKYFRKCFGFGGFRFWIFEKVTVVITTATWKNGVRPVSPTRRIKEGMWIYNTTRPMKKGVNPSRPTEPTD